MTWRERVEARLWIWSLPVWRGARWFAQRRHRTLTREARLATEAAAEAAEMAGLAQQQIDGIELLRSAADRG